MPGHFGFKRRCFLSNTAGAVRKFLRRTYIQSEKCWRQVQQGVAHNTLAL